MTLAATDLDNAKVAVFANNKFVDTVNDPEEGHPESEVKNVIASLKTFDHDVSTFTATSAKGLSAALAGADVLLIPEMEHKALNLSDGAEEVLRDFVASGHTLVIHADDGAGAVGLLNEVFGFNLAAASAKTDILLTGDATGTVFGTGPDVLHPNNGTDALDTTTLPGGSLNIFGDAGESSVSVMGFGAGQIVFLGWDWYDAAPKGAQDDGWLTVLDHAISTPDGDGATIHGTAFNDLINGRVSAPSEAVATIRNDQIYGGDGKDRLYGLEGDDYLRGDEKNDRLYGGDGDDFLDGRLGRDRLKGGAGEDSFATVDTAADSDVIVDFKPGVDTMFVGYNSLGSEITEDEFVKGTKADEAHGQLIYDRSSGKLWIDDNGTDAGGKVLIFTLLNHAKIEFSDFEYWP